MAERVNTARELRKMIKIHALISGRVQGVGFRWATRKEATRLGLCGWVRNLPDGRVELTAEGDAATVETFLRWCHQGPPNAAVEHVEIIERVEVPAPSAAGFDVRS